MSTVAHAQPAPDLRTKLLRAWHRLGYLRYEPTAAVAGLLVVVLSYLVLAPIGAMVLDTVRVQFRDSATAGLRAGALTTYYLDRALLSGVSGTLLWGPLVQTLIVAVAVAAISLVLGSLLAWLVVRTDLPGRRWLAPALIIPYILPSWTFAVAWLSLFKNRRLAGLPGFAESLGFSPPDWLAYGALPIIICEALHSFPFAFLLFGSALRSLDGQLEESGQILGASRPVILRRIVLPLLLPALMSAVLLTFSRTVGSFGTPYILGSPVRYTLLPTSLYGNFKAGSPGVAAVLAVVMIVLGVSLVALDIYFLREHRRFVTLGGKGGTRRTIRLGAWRPVFAALATLAFVVATVVPLGTLALATLMKRPGVFSLDNLTAEFWLATTIPINPGQSGLLRNAAVLDAAWNSMRIAGSAALACGLIGMFVGYSVVRLPNSRISHFLRHVSFLPYLVPSIGFAAAYLSLFALQRGPIPALYGSMLLVVIVMGVKYLPYASRAGISAMMQLGNEPEEAAMICGAPWHKRLARIVIPIQKSALMLGILLPFISGMKELSLVVMLATPGTELLTTQVLRYTDYGYSQLSNAVVLVIVALIFALTFMVQRLTGSGLAAEVEG